MSLYPALPTGHVSTPGPAPWSAAAGRRSRILAGAQPNSASSRLSPGTPLFGRRQHLEVVEHLKLIGLETVDRSHLGGRGRALQPGGRTPTILIGHAHQAVVDRVLMDVIQPGVVRPLVGQALVPVVEPDL